MLRESELGILADDLTGACDAAAAFAPVTGPVRIMLRPPRGRAMTGRLTVINTQSRLLRPGRSRTRVMKAARSLRDLTVVYKKTDSALRGPVGAELEGVSRALPGRRFFVIPAVPEMGKTTRGGRLFERGIPADQTEYGKDPATPVLDNDIRRIILGTGRVDFDIVDAESSDDIDRGVEKALAAGPVVLAGSVGLADALARRLEPRPWSEPAGRARPRTLVVNGSRYPAAREQLELAARASGQDVISVRSESKVQDIVSRVHGRNVVFLQIETRMREGRCHARRALARLFKKLGCIILAYEPGAVGLIGGETAFRVLRLQRTTQLLVLGREELGMPYGIITDGALKGRAFATKGGSVGARDACVRMVGRLMACGSEVT